MISIASGCKVTTFPFPHLGKSVRSLLHIRIKFLRFWEVVGKVLKEVVVKGKENAFDKFGVEGEGLFRSCYLQKKNDC